MSNIPNPDQIRQAAAEGQPISREDVADISHAEGGQHESGGPAATAHSMYSRQRNFEKKAEDILSKPTGAVSKQDASELQSAETRARGRQPRSASLSSDVQSLADENENEARAMGMNTGLMPDIVGTEPTAPSAPYITKRDAAEAQAQEASLYGRQLRGGLASQMQSSADKLETARRRSS